MSSYAGKTNECKDSFPTGAVLQLRVLMKGMAGGEDVIGLSILLGDLIRVITVLKGEWKSWTQKLTLGGFFTPSSSASSLVMAILSTYQ